MNHPPVLLPAPPRLANFNHTAPTGTGVSAVLVKPGPSNPPSTLCTSRLCSSPLYAGSFPCRSHPQCTLTAIVASCLASSSTSASTAAAACWAAWGVGWWGRDSSGGWGLSGGRGGRGSSTSGDGGGGGGLR